MSRQLIENLQYLAYTLDYLTGIQVQVSDFRLADSGSITRLETALRHFGVSAGNDQGILAGLGYVLARNLVENELRTCKRLTKDIVEFYSEKSSVEGIHLSAETPTIQALQQVQEYRVKVRAVRREQDSKNKMRSNLIRVCKSGFYRGFLKYENWI